MKIETIQSIISLPSKFYLLEKESMRSLLAKTGYFELYDQIEVQDIYQVLNKYEKAIEQWLDWSENKRVTSGWYFKRIDEFYIVGHFPDTKYDTYSDPIKACATFIKYEIEDIRHG